MFHFSLEAGLDAARSETLVAGLKLVLAFLQPERKCEIPVCDTDSRSSCKRSSERTIIPEKNAASLHFKIGALPEHLTL